MTPGIKQHGEPPPGVMPRHLQYVVLGGIAALVIAATLWTGGKPRKAEERPPLAVPAPAQLQTYQQMLERQRREGDQDAERRRAQLQEKLLSQTVPAPELAPGIPAGVPDPLEEISRKRAATAPFASSYVVSINASDEKHKEKEKDAGVEIDRASQIVFTGEINSKDAKPSAGTAEPLANVKDAPNAKESGRRLLAQEGNLFRLFEGTMVRAILVNRLDGSFTGPVNCVVTAAVLSQNETALLIPKGSRFIGTASRVEAGNQTRLAVIFKRLIMPNGYSINLEAAPGLDNGGETGLKGKVNNHDLRKFGMAGAVGLLGGLALLGSQANPYAAGLANATGGSATNILNHYLNVLPTITIPEGHAVNVYLPTDLLLPAYRP